MKTAFDPLVNRIVKPVWSALDKHVPRPRRSHPAEPPRPVNPSVHAATERLPQTVDPIDPWGRRTP